jgi:hypothetical protein
MTPTNRSLRVPTKLRKRYDAIVALSDAFCAEHMDARFARLARLAAAALSRKRPSPLEHGRANTWACGILYALCHVNFIFDKGQPHHISPADLCAALGVAERTGQDRSRRVRQALKMSRFDPDWYLPSQANEDPLAWYITVQGVPVDARTMPREVQEIAYEKGLIPYLPDD